MTQQSLQTPTAFSRQILSPATYEFFKNLIDNDKTVIPDLLIYNLLATAGFFGTNKIYIRAGNEGSISSNIILFVIGLSGTGKSRSSKLFTENVIKIQFELNKVVQDHVSFIKACSAKEMHHMYPQSVEKVSVEDKNLFIEKYNAKHNTSFDEWGTVPMPEHTIFSNNFTPEKLLLMCNNSKNSCIMVYFDEVQGLEDNFLRTSNKKSEFGTELIEYHDGRNANVARVRDGTISVKDAKINLVVNTTPETYNRKLRHTDIISSGLAPRAFFYVQPYIKSVPPSKTIPLSQHDGLGAYDTAKIHLGVIIQNYFFDMLYNNDNEPIILQIQSDEGLSFFDEKVRAIYDEYIEPSEVMSNNEKVSATNRIKEKLTKCILILHIANYAFDNFGTWEKFTSYSELSIEAIERGYNFYRYATYQQQLISDNTEISDLEGVHKEMIELLNLDIELDLDRFKEIVLKSGKGSESSYKRLIKNDKSNAFKIYENKLTKKRMIRRLI